MPQRDVVDFIKHWSAASASERANSQAFLLELCELLEVPAPDNHPNAGYLFEYPVTEHHAEGSIFREQSACDENSIVADALFVDAAKGDYRVKEGSPVLALGFRNFPMDQFGVKSERLRQIARTPKLPVPGEEKEKKSKRDSRVTTWLGAKAKNIISLGEVSAAGLPGEIGVSLQEVPAGSAAAKFKLEVGDVVLKCDGKPSDSGRDLERRWLGAAAGPVRLEIWRGQKAIAISVDPRSLVKELGQKDEV